MVKKMNFENIIEVISGSILAASAAIGITYFGMAVLGNETAKEVLNEKISSITEYVKSQHENPYLSGKTPFVKVSVKKGDTLDFLTNYCAGRPNGETSKLDLREAVYSANSLGKYIHPGEEIFVPFDKNNTNNLEKCVFRAEKDSSGKVKLYSLK